MQFLMSIIGLACLVLGFFDPPNVMLLWIAGFAFLGLGGIIGAIKRR